MLIVLFIISVLLFGGYTIGPASIRVYMSVLTFCYLIYYLARNRNLQFRLQYTDIKIYLLFSFVTLIAKVFSGPFEIDGYIKVLLSRYLVCVVGFIAIDLLIQNSRQLQTILNVLIGIIVFNSIITIMQYNGDSISLVIGQSFSTVELDSISSIEDKLIVSTGERPLYIPPGIFGHGAINGYMNAVLGILVLYYVLGKKERYYWIGTPLFILIAIGCFVIQERSPMGIFILISLFLGLKYKFRYVLGGVALTIIGLIFTPQLWHSFDIEHLGRYSRIFDLDPERQYLWSSAVNFITEHWFLGGDYLYHQLYHITPHNFILHAFIYSGAIGALIIFYLFFRIIKAATRILLNKSNGMSLFFACALIIHLAVGFTHSSSLITGDVIIWILYALMLRSRQIEKTITSKI